MDTATEKLLISIPDACAALGGISRGKLYSLINAGELTHANVGSRGFVVAQSLHDYVQRISTPQQRD